MWLGSKGILFENALKRRADLNHESKPFASQISVLLVIAIHADRLGGGIDALENGVEMRTHNVGSNERKSAFCDCLENLAGVWVAATERPVTVSRLWQRLLAR
jgi:hypothetical protein